MTTDATPTVYVVAGGDLVAVFADRYCARLQFEAMTGVNLEPVIVCVSESAWQTARTRLRQQRQITIVDVRPGHRDD